MSRRARARLTALDVGVVVVVALAVGVALAIGTRASRPPARLPARPAAGATVQPAKPVPPRSASSPRAQGVAPRVQEKPAVGPTVGPTYRVAIVFDDAGGSLADVEEIIAIGRPVAVAVLPGLSYSTEVARRVRAAGLEVLLHIPVEPHDDVKAMGPGGVTVAMTDAEIQSVVRFGLASVPGAVGVNNHMGSRGTADRRVVRAILEVVRDRHLFFIDSRTTVDTVVEPVAAELGVPVARRLVFLDNEEEEEAIRQQMRRLIALAKERGSAIAIGHAQRITPRVVREMLEELDREDVTIVPVSRLVR